MQIRKTTYLQNGQPISLAFLNCLADEHPEHIDPPPPEQPAKLRRPPRFNVSRPSGRNSKASADFERVLQRIERGGV